LAFCETGFGVRRNNPKDLFFFGGEEESNIACRLDGRDIRVAIPKVVLVSGWLFEAVGEFTVGKIENGLGEI
jgi:hypothetical protein